MLSLIKTALFVLALSITSCTNEPQSIVLETPHSVALPVFVDVATESGFSFHHTSAASPKKYFPETMGGGGGFIDVNNDGWLDIYAINGAWIFQSNTVNEQPTNALYMQSSPNRFTEQAEQFGINHHGVGMGLGVGDMDNDGDQDIYVTNFGPNVLYRNDGKEFTDISLQTGTDNTKWGTSCAWGDYDRDGDLDLYIANYVVYDATTHNADFVPYIAPNDGHADAATLGYPHPANFHAAPDLLYQNDGNGNFSDASQYAGIQLEYGKGLGVVFGDYNNDGWPDIYVANDATANFLYHNNGDGTFNEKGALTGTAYGQDGQMEAGMGVDWGDFNNDGFLDLTVTNFQSEPNALYHNNGNNFFANASYASGTGLITLPFLGFGTQFLDYDKDGRLDLFVVNGHVLDNIERFDQSASYAQSNLLLRNAGPNEYGKVSFNDISATAGPALQRQRVGRGSSTADYDNDGDLDLAVFNLGQAAALLRNDSNKQMHWLGLKLTGIQSNRDAIGTRVTVFTKSGLQIREVRGGRSYLSHSDLRLHFGLGTESQVDSLTIRWPSGKMDIRHQINVDQYMQFTEGD